MEEVWTASNRAAMMRVREKFPSQTSRLQLRLDFPGTTNTGGACKPLPICQVYAGWFKLGVWRHRIFLGRTMQGSWRIPWES
jgi:hypothetical protein